MGGRSQPFPSLEWVGADCERNVWKNSSQGVRARTVPVSQLRSESRFADIVTGQVQCACGIGAVIPLC